MYRTYPACSFLLKKIVFRTCNMKLVTTCPFAKKFPFGDSFFRDFGTYRLIQLSTIWEPVVN